MTKMIQIFLRKIKKHHEFILSFVTLFFFSFTVTLFASPPGTAYNPGEILDPGCAPSATNCSVTLFPDQTGNSGKFLKTDGAGVLSWDTPAGSGSLIGATSDTETETWLGDQAGANSAATEKTVFIGVQAGDGATASVESTFVGYQAGLNSGGGGGDVAIGSYSGSNVTIGGNSVFVGRYSGNGAANAANSVFLGYNAGFSASTAKNSIFIGQDSGNSDSVDNTMSGWSIAIGSTSGTGGYQNSIALGGSAVNTAANQLFIASSITDLNFRGVNYQFPSSQGAVGSALINNGSGVLTWNRQTRTLFDHYNDVASVAGFDTDFYEDTLPANILSADGDKIFAKYGGFIASSFIYDMRLSFAGDSNSSCYIASSSQTSWSTTVTIIRTSSSSVRILLECFGDNLVIPVGYYTITGLDFTSPINMKLTAITNGDVTPDNFIARMGSVQFLPAAN